MKKTLFPFVFLFLLAAPVFLKAQQNHFLYFQTEGRQPFYAKLDKKVISSSASGYLIIPKLKDGTYNIAIGFPKSEMPEQSYVCNVNNNDAGYLVKNFGDKGWGIFNLQTLEVLMSGNKEKGKDMAATEKADVFSSMLSDVVNDPSIKQNDQSKQEAKPKEDKKAETGTKVEPKEVKAEAVTKTEIAAKQEKPEEQKLPVNAITKIKVTSDIDGQETIYTDMNNGKLDTIRVFIPAEKNTDAQNTEVTKTENTVKQDEKPKEEAKTAIIDSPSEKPVPADNEETHKIIKTAKEDTLLREAKQDTNPSGDVSSGTPKSDNSSNTKFLPIELPSPNKQTEDNNGNKANEAPATGARPPEATTAQVLPPTPMINSDCKSNATEDDFLKLRKKMAAVEVDEEMISVAKKYFKTKCFTTEQVKNLSFLFLKDSGKYNFFDLAYQFVSDSHNFGILESQLTDAYFISRFKAMIRH